VNFGTYIPIVLLIVLGVTFVVNFTYSIINFYINIRVGKEAKDAIIGRIEDTHMVTLEVFKNFEGEGEGGTDQSDEMKT
jgi:hypothetical protein